MKNIKIDYVNRIDAILDFVKCKYFESTDKLIEFIQEIDTFLPNGEELVEVEIGKCFSKYFTEGEYTEEEMIDFTLDSYINRNK